MPIYSVLSDIHANIEAFDAVHEDWDATDRLIFLGDLFDRGSSPARVYNKMTRLDKVLLDTVWLAGNHDRAVGWAKQPEAHPEWQYFHGTLSEDYQASSRVQARALHVDHVMGAATRPGSRLVTMPEGLLAFAAHGFPASDEQKALTSYDHEFSPCNGRVVNYAPLRAFAGQAGLWLVGHSHVPSAWMWSSQDGWHQLCPGFGRGLDGHFATQQNLGNGTAVTLMESELDLGLLTKGDLLILNPGSVGEPRDVASAGSVAYAEYLRLDISGTRLRVCFRAVPYSPI